ncbi:MAG: class I SAM-dependent methyltransferase [Patescibacteria group bacterium]|jgi:SAM-dependent methyltransferase
MQEFEKVNQDLKIKCDNQAGLFFYLPKVTQFQQQEILFHNAIHQDEEEVHQLNSLRNTYYHDYFKKYFSGFSNNSIILEIGAGSGYDSLSLLKMGYNLIVSDISPESISGIKQKINEKYPQHSSQVIYLVADGQNLPLPDNSVNAVFIVASLHHFERQDIALQEMFRVVKPGGMIICAMEPSRFMMSFTKLFKNSARLRIHHGHSEADETHPGYDKRDWQRLIAALPLSVIKFKRVWLLQGFLHYGLEALYRLFKLKKRIRIPLIIEWLFLLIDEILLQLPLIKKLNWHWIVILEKK